MNYCALVKFKTIILVKTGFSDYFKLHSYLRTAAAICYIIWFNTKLLFLALEI